MAEEKELIKHVGSKEEFEKIISDGKPVLVDFFATWCGPCQMMGPVLEDMATNYKSIDKVEIIKVDIDEVSDLSTEFSIMSVPTFMLFNEGKPVETMVGVRSGEELTSKLDKLVGSEK